MGKLEKTQGSIVGHDSHGQEAPPPKPVDQKKENPPANKSDLTADESEGYATS